MLKISLNTAKNSFKRFGLSLLNRLPISSEIIGSPKGWIESTFEYLKALDSSDIKKHYIEIYPSHWIERSKPKTIEENVDWRFNQGYLGSKFKTPSAFVALIPNGRIYGINGAIISPNDKLLADVSIEFGVPPSKAKNHSVFKRVKLPNIQKIDDTVAVLSAAGGTTMYFHWMFDVLPRLHLLKRSGMFDQVNKFIVNEIRYEFQRETLDILKIPKDKIITTHINFHIKASTLILPSLPGITGSMPGWTCDFLRETFLSNPLIKNQDRIQRIYISRINAKYRRIFNESEIMDFLRKLNFKICKLENLSILEQAALFASAEAVVAPHGGGLTNLVFCQEGSKVIELFSPSYINPCYRALSNLRGLDYYYLLGEGQPTYENTDDHLRNSTGEDFSINMNTFSRLIELSGII
jgi:capsular polysaccharide biosynthesis protein